MWARADRPARMMVEAATTESFKDIIRAVSADALPDSDFTAKALLDRPAGRSGHLLSRALPRYRVADDRGRAAGRPLPHGAERRARRVVRVVRRHRGRLGHRRVARRHAHLRDDAAQSAGFLHPLRRQHLCRVPAWARAEAAERRGLAQPRHRREIARRRNARRLSRQLQIQSARPQSARLQRRGPDLRAMGRPRGHQRLVAGHAAARRRCRHHRARGARLPGVPRVHADAAVRGRARAHLSQDRLRAAARRVHARHAQLSRAERRRQAGRVRPGRAFPRARAGRVAQARTGGLARDLEGDRGRPADRRDELRRGRAGRRPAARARARDRRPAVVHQACGRAQHGVDHRRHALHGGALLRSEPRGVPGFRAVLGVHVGPIHAGTGGPGAARQHVRPARGLPECMQQGAGRRSRAVLRPAVLRACGDRRRDRGHDRDAEGCRGPRAVVDRAGAASRRRESRGSAYR